MPVVTPRLRLFLLLTLGVVVLGGGGAAYAVQQQVFGVRTADVADAIRLRLALPAAPPAGAATPASPAGMHAGLAAVYAARDAQPLWMLPAARDAALAMLSHADIDGVEPATLGLDPLAADAARPPSDSSLARLDLALTDALLRYGDALVAPRADPAALYGSNWTPAAPVAVDPAAALAAAVASPETDAVAAMRAWADGLRPRHPGYRALRGVLVRETLLADRPDLLLARDLAPGDTGRAVASLRERLGVEAEATGDAVPPADDARRFDTPLSDALVAVQTRAGVPASGRLDSATRRVLNRRQTEMVPLVRLNMERWRWLPDTLGALHVWANIPSFEIVVRDQTPAGWEDALVTRSVVGQRGWKTPVFSDTMETVVFNPTWMMPASIQRESYGRLRPDRALRQPGPGNALGRVKFLFPNDHAVYIHDTPSKWAFQVDDRARSHGCVRAGDPRDLAVALLTRTNGWTTEQVDAIMTGPWILQSVPLDRPVPVHIVYLTATADAAGRVHVIGDVYGYDARLAGVLGLSLDSVPAPLPAS